jgi:hypothetical protein
VLSLSSQLRYLSLASEKFDIYDDNIYRSNKRNYWKAFFIKISISINKERYKDALGVDLTLTRIDYNT